MNDLERMQAVVDRAQILSIARAHRSPQDQFRRDAETLYARAVKNYTDPFNSKTYA